MSRVVVFAVCTSCVLRLVCGTFGTGVGPAQEILQTPRLGGLVLGGAEGPVGGDELPEARAELAPGAGVPGGGDGVRLAVLAASLRVLKLRLRLRLKLRFGAVVEEWDCEGMRACCVRDLVCGPTCARVDDVVVVCVVVLVDEAVDGAGLGFDLEGTCDNGRNVVAAWMMLPSLSFSLPVLDELMELDPAASRLLGVHFRPVWMTPWRMNPQKPA
ncbi:hypothetical protein ONZ43_g7490 [Nemania bipapillata]|uniref:Uncharacterized protein n=1 Tax=Nemania bipapillata TaxID=110536 RepID=A0ACC2HR14_9PEZI|nr:hypothetical protein ONZ43_g7490 [Nemania bipapillata]